MFWQYTSVVRTKIGFNSRTDLLKKINGLFVQWEDAWFATRKSGVRIPDGPLCDTGSWSNGKTPSWHGENLGSIPSESTDMEGSRIRLAGPHC